MINRIIVMFLFIIILLVGAEFAYFAYIHTVPGLKTDNKSAQADRAYLASVKACTENPPEAVVKMQALNESALRSLRYYKQGLVASSAAVTELSGKIIQIENKPGTSAIGTNYDKLLKIQGGKDSANTFELSDKKMDLVTVSDKRKGEERQIQFNDLRKGDTVTIKITNNLLKTPDDWLVNMAIVKTGP